MSFTSIPLFNASAISTIDFLSQDLKELINYKPKYCDKYDSQKINSILKQIEFDELTEDEIRDYEIKVSEEAEENQEI